MDDLLARVLDVHGGLDNWSNVTSVTYKLTLDGPFWDWRGWPQIRREQTVTQDARHERITFTPFLGQKQRMVFDGDPSRVEVYGSIGEALEDRDDPELSFPAYHDSVSWDSIQLGYFVGTANWGYQTEPFLFTYPGVEAREVEPWEDSPGETWRRLQVTFPDNLLNQNAEQTFYYDDDFMLRRMDYAPDVIGSSLTAHYVYDPTVFDGFVFYTRRLVHRRNENNTADVSFSPITIGTHEVAVERS